VLIVLWFDWCLVVFFFGSRQDAITAIAGGGGFAELRLSMLM
jgi:hypothetical protein